MAYNADQRAQMAKTGDAMPNGDFPIKTPKDVHDSIGLLGVYKGDKVAAKAHIIKRAKALGCTNMLPDGWSVTAHADPAALEPGTVTVTDVEIVRVGNWASQLSGRVPITADDLQAMVAAASDPEVDHAPVKIGHVDPRFDGEPAFGWLTNIRQAGDRVLADITDVPKQMAHLVKTAFKRRSAEIAWGVKTPSGKSYKAALCGLALLGVTPPAVKGLADVVARYSGPTNEADDRGSVTVVDDNDGELAGLAAGAINASAAYEARRQYLSAHSGDLHAQPVQSLLNASALLEGPMTEPAAPSVDPTAAPAPTDPATPPVAATTPAEPAAPAPVPAVAVAPVAPVATPTVQVDAAALAQLQADAAAGAEARRILAEQERERVLTAALSGGKIAPNEANVNLWRAAYDKDPAQTSALLAGMPQVFSTVTNFSGLAASTGPAPDGSGFTEDQWAAFEADLQHNGLR